MKITTACLVQQLNADLHLQIDCMGSDCRKASL